MKLLRITASHLFESLIKRARIYITHTYLQCGTLPRKDRVLKTLSQKNGCGAQRLLRYLFGSVCVRQLNEIRAPNPFDRRPTPQLCIYMYDGGIYYTVRIRNIALDLWMLVGGAVAQKTCASELNDDTRSYVTGVCVYLHLFKGAWVLAQWPPTTTTTMAINVRHVSNHHRWLIWCLCN